MSEGWLIEHLRYGYFMATKEYGTLNHEKVKIILHPSGIDMIKELKRIDLYTWDEEDAWFLEVYNANVKDILSEADINDMLGSGRVLIES